MLLIGTFGLQHLQAKRMQFVKQKCFSYTKGNVTSTIHLRYITTNKYTGEIVIATEGTDDAQAVGLSGVDTKGKISHVFNDSVPPIDANSNFSKQTWQITKNAKGQETLKVKYFIKGKKIKYVTYTYTACDINQ